MNCDERGVEYVNMRHADKDCKSCANFVIESELYGMWWCDRNRFWVNHDDQCGFLEERTGHENRP